MRYSHLVALTRHVDGREDEFNDWYTMKREALGDRVLTGPDAGIQSVLFD